MRQPRLWYAEPGSDDWRELPPAVVRRILESAPSMLECVVESLLDADTVVLPSGRRVRWE